jgi:3-hydroxyacyl-CoA dehydrogenase
MGSGIAQTTATAGYETVCCDISQQVVDKAVASVQSGRFGFERAVERGKLSREDAEAAHARLRFTTEFEAAAATDLVIECVPEKLDLKVRVMRQLDATAPESTILASNTSGFPIAALAAATERPGLVIGWHWASPPVVMKFAEIVVTAETSEAATKLVRDTAEACGKHPVVVKDNPMAWGFVANRIYSAMLREAARVVDEGIASHEEVNQLMVDCFAWPVGPFAMVKGAGSGWQ